MWDSYCLRVRDVDFRGAGIGILGFEAKACKGGELACEGFRAWDRGFGFNIQSFECSVYGRVPDIVSDNNPCQLFFWGNIAGSSSTPQNLMDQCY